METIPINIELLSHNFSGKPVHTFPDCALERLNQTDRGVYHRDAHHETF
jgi:hypothetical protein